MLALIVSPINHKFVSGAWIGYSNLTTTRISNPNLDRLFQFDHNANLQSQ